MFTTSMRKPSYNDALMHALHGLVFSSGKILQYSSLNCPSSYSVNLSDKKTLRLMIFFNPEPVPSNNFLMLSKTTLVYSTIPSAILSLSYIPT